MSGRWIVLGDTRVRVDGQTCGDPQRVVTALHNLYGPHEHAWRPPVVPARHPPGAPPPDWRDEEPAGSALPILLAMMVAGAGLWALLIWGVMVLVDGVASLLE